MSLVSSAGHSLLRIADLRVDPTLDEICKDGHTIKLEPKAMQLLICLAERAGEVLSVEQLLDLVWKDVVVSHDSVYAAVAALRRTLGDDPKNPRYIANVVRRGYRLIAPVSPWLDSPADPTTNAPPALADKPSIVVVPFVNSSGDPTQESFSDGITEDIITELSRWRLLAVRSRSASFRYRRVAVDLRQVARELNVRFVVEGSVRRMGERVRISVQLVDAETGSHIWVEKFDRALEEICAVQDQVVQTIVSTLVGRVQVSDAERARRKPPTSLAAYECVLKGNALSWDDPDGAAEATRLFEKAILLDPRYAFAHALLAVMFKRRWENEPHSSEGDLEEAYTLARRAVELDDGLSTCHAILGQVCVLRREIDLGVQYLRRAVEINPNNQWNATDLGCVLVNAGKSEEALTWFSRAREIDPYFDLSWHWRGVARAYLLLHRYEDALSALTHSRVRRCQDAALAAGCHARLGDGDRARISTAECLSMRPDFSIAEFMRKDPFKIPADAEQLASSLRLAGLPD
jgi:adenylate cyclase